MQIKSVSSVTVIGWIKKGVCTCVLVYVKLTITLRMGQS